MSGIFDKNYIDYDSWYDRNRAVYLSELEAVKESLPKEGRGLEVGVGTARFAGALDIDFGIDNSKNMLDIARKRAVDVVLGYGEELPFKNSVFDYLAIIISICFVKDPRQVLKEAKRVLNNQGKVIVAIINKSSFLGELYRKKKSLFYKEANLFGVEDIVELLRNAGFKNFSYIQTLFDIPDKIDSIDRPEQGYDKGGFVVISAEV
jgi:ubiquinone/menaquinone biosynthesis C-methylase UbiE